MMAIATATPTMTQNTVMIRPITNLIASATATIKTKATFAGEWTRSGDKYTRDADGFYTYGGRTDDIAFTNGILLVTESDDAATFEHQEHLLVHVMAMVRPCHLPRW